MDVNCDLGEWENPARTAALMRRITSANIACGVHAGSVASMDRCIELAIRHQVNIGAHPGVPGEKGRGVVELNESAFVHLLLSQVLLLKHLAEQRGAVVSHIKLHGSLYHWSEKPAHARWYVQAVKVYFPSMRIFALPNGAVYREAAHEGILVWREIFADRGYLSSGDLAPRQTAGAVLSDPAQVARRVEHYVSTNTIETLDQTYLPIKAETICIHGDTENAPAMAELVASRLRKV